MVLGTIFRSRGGDNIVSYSYDEIVSGTGIVTLYGAHSDGSYLLTPSNLIQSIAGKTDASASGGGTVQWLDVDFDVKMNKHTVLRGPCIVNVTVNNTTNGNDIYIIAKLRHWDGSTETEVESGTGDTLTHAAGEALVHAAYFEVDPQKIYKPGDYIRLTIEVWSTTSNTATISIAHNPNNASLGWTSGGSDINEYRLKFPMPTRIVQ